MSFSNILRTKFVLNWFKISITLNILGLEKYEFQFKFKNILKLCIDYIISDVLYKLVQLISFEL